MRRDRAWALVVGLLIAGVAGLVFYQQGPSASFLPHCMFHRLTGLNCPGCGMTRAVHAALHGRLGEAFRFNPVGMILFPAALAGIGAELIGWLRGKPLPLRFRVSRPWGWALVGVMIVFWILRNIPAWPFTLLSPP